MNKKILAGALASVMAVACAANVSALETETEGADWWQGHTTGVEITADGIEITFNSTSYENADGQWHAPLYVVYAGDEAKVEGAGYYEYFVCRSDLYGWTGPATIGDYNTNGDLPAGWSFDRENIPDDWATFLAECKAGVSCSLKAVKGDGTVTVEFTVNGTTSKAVIPAADEHVYVSLFADHAKLTNIKLVDNTPAPTDDEKPAPGEGENPPAPGDTTGGTDPNKDKPTVDTGVEGVAIVAGLAIVAAGAVVVAKKRK